MRLALISVCALCFVALGPPALSQGECPDSTFTSATAFCLDLAGNAFVIDKEGNFVWKVSRASRCIGGVGGYGWSTVSFDRPSDIAYSNNLDLYVADYGNHRILRYDRNLNFVSTIPPESTPENTPVPFRYPRSVAVSRLGALYIIDGDNARLVKYTNENSVDQTFGNTGIGKARLRAPTRVRITADDMVYVQDGAELKLFDSFGNFVGTVGNGLFRKPVIFTVDRSSVYVLDSTYVYAITGNARIDTLTSLNGLQDRLERAEIADIAVFRDTMFALTSGKVSPIIVLPKPLPAK